MRTSHLRTATAGGVLVLLTAGTIALATTERGEDALAATPVPTAVPETSVAVPSASPSPDDEDRDDADANPTPGAESSPTAASGDDLTGTAPQREPTTAPRAATDSANGTSRSPRPSPAPTRDRPSTPAPSPSPSPEATDDRGPLGELVDSLLGR